MSKVTQQIDIRDRFWAAPQTLPFTSLLQNWRHDSTWPMTGKGLTVKIHEGHLLAFWEGRQTQAPTLGLERTDIMWKGHRTQPVDLDQRFFKAAFWHLLLLVNLPPSGLFSPHIIMAGMWFKRLSMSKASHSSLCFIRVGQFDLQSCWAIGNWLRTGPCKQLEHDLFLWVCSHTL